MASGDDDTIGDVIGDWLVAISDGDVTIIGDSIIAGEDTVDLDADRSSIRLSSLDKRSDNFIDEGSIYF